MNVLIPRNSVIPIKRKRKYTTDKDNETSVIIKVFEGEREMTVDNFIVGEFELLGLEAAPIGIAQIEVSFSVDMNGIISVEAVDIKNSDNKKAININSNKGRLTPDKIKELVREAKNAELKDKVIREKKQWFYELDDLCNCIKNNIANKDFQVKDKDKENILIEITKITKWLQEMSFDKREKKDYLDLLKRIKTKYGTLLLRTINNNNDELKSNSESVGTSVYDDEDEQQVLPPEIL